MKKQKYPPCDRRWVNNRQTMRFWSNTNCVQVNYTIIGEGGDENVC